MNDKQRYLGEEKRLTSESPKKIYLIFIGDDELESIEGVPFGDLACGEDLVLWSEDGGANIDIEYIRADVVAQMVKDAGDEAYSNAMHSMNEPFSG